MVVVALARRFLCVFLLRQALRSSLTPQGTSIYENLENNVVNTMMLFRLHGPAQEVHNGWLRCPDATMMSATSSLHR